MASFTGSRPRDVPQVHIQRRECQTERSTHRCGQRNGLVRSIREDIDWVTIGVERVDGPCVRNTKQHIGQRIAIRVGQVPGASRQTLEVDR